MAARTSALSPALLNTVAGATLEAAETAQMGIAVSVIDGAAVRRLYVSDAAARILGYSAEELVGGSTFMSFPPEERARMQALSSEWLRGGVVPFFLESVILTSDGRRVPVEVAFSPAEIDGKPATVTFFRDIGERKRTQEALLQSASLFRKLIEAAPEAVTVSRDHVLVYANPRCLELLGYQDFAELAQKTPDDLIHPEDRTHVSERVQLFVESETTPRALREYRLFHKDGGSVSVECSSLAIDFEGAPAILRFMRDITARKETQAQLIQTDRMATIGTLAGAVAHELNNPLAYVMLNLGLLERELDGLVAPSERETVRARLRLLQDGAAQMASIIQDLRSFCRPNSPPVPVDVRQVVESAINMAMNEIKGRGRLVRDYAPVPCVLADGARLGQVFLNLLVNAAQALPERDSADNEIRVVLRADSDGCVSIAFKDSGHGIAPDVLGRIFEPFFTTKPPGTGTGLGLSISKTIITGMMGHLTVESAVGQGSTFRVVLPATQQASEREDDASNAVTGADTDAHVRRKVLVVDDEVALAGTLRAVLEAHHQVTAVTSGSDALTLLLGDASFDVILCDVLMPGLSGIDLHGELERQRPELARRIIFMSGASWIPRTAEFLAKIPNPHIEKPIDVPRLRALIRDT